MMYLLLFCTTLLPLALPTSAGEVITQPPPTTPKPSKYDVTFEQPSYDSALPPIGHFLERLIKIKESSGKELSEISLNETFPDYPSDVTEHSPVYIKLEQLIALVNNDIRGSLLYPTVSDEKTAEFLLKFGADLNFKDEYEDTALHFAAKRGNLEVVKWLIEKHNSNVNAKNKDGKTALHKAAETGKSEVIQYLIDHEANINEQDNKGNTALHLAGIANSLSSVETLAKANIDVNIQNNELNTAFYEVLYSKNENLDLLKYLINLPNIDINLSNKDKRTALYIAEAKYKINSIKIIVESGKLNNNTTDLIINDALDTAIKVNNTEIFEWILKTYLDKITVNSYRSSAVLTAIEADNLEMLKKLFETGKYDVNAVGIEQVGHTKPLNMAIWQTNLDIIKYLMEDLNAKYDLGMLESAIRKGKLATVKYLIENYNFSINQKEDNPLLKSISEGKLDIAKYFIFNTTADLNVTDNDGRDALLLAASKGRFNIVKLLIEKANVSDSTKDNEGRNALLLAANEGSLDIVKFLIEEAKFSSNTTDNEGKTILHLAARSGPLDLVKYLIEQVKIAVNTKDKEGQTALHSAAVRFKIKNMDYLSKVEGIDVDAVDRYGRTADQLKNNEGIKYYLYTRPNYDD